MIRCTLLWLLATAGCAHLQGELPVPEVRPPSQQMRVGAAAVDITPPPGFVMGGHSIEGQRSRGVWTRLIARSLYIEGPGGTPLALVATDLWGLPAGLNDRVAELVATEHGVTHLGREHIVVAATHTHHGPANFATSRIFTRFVGPKPGFDPTLFEFLARRIAASVAMAAGAAQPASLRYGARVVEGVARNRSLEPFLENPEAAHFVGTDAPSSRDPLLAVDKRVRVLTASRLDDPKAIIGVVAVFAAHPTAMPNTLTLSSGDFFSVAARDAERALSAPVVALFNGAEGDVSPNWKQQGRADAVRLGRTLGNAIAEIAGAGGEPVGGEVGVAFGRVAVAGRSFVDERGVHVRTADRGFPGTATIGGAEDGRTRWHARGFTEGRVAPHERLPGHGPKRPPVAKGVLSMAIPAGHVPRTVDVGVYRLGSRILVSLPGEFTTVMGLRVRTAVARAAGVAPARVIAIGLAGSHLEYFATRQEYALQHYEGSSTFYGPHSGSIVASRSADIAAAGYAEVVRRYAYQPGRRRSFPVGASRLRRKSRRQLARDLGLQSLDARPSFAFEDRQPPWPPNDALDPVTPRVAIEVREKDGSWTVWADDRGSSVALIATRSTRSRIEWLAVWLDPPQTDRSFRFSVTRVDGSAHTSEAIR